MTIQCARCGKDVEVKWTGARPKYCPDCAYLSKLERSRDSRARGQDRIAKANAELRHNADLWDHAIEVMRQTGKSYRECQVEGLFYTTEVDQI